MASIINVDKVRATGSTTDGVLVNSSGQVTLPKIPYVMVNRSSTVSINTSGTTDVPYDNVLSSQGISWNTSTYQFTVPVAGLYNFSGAVRLDADRHYVYWQVTNSSNTAIQGSKLVLSQGYSGAGFTTAVGSCMLSLSTGTNYKIRVGDANGTSVNLADAQTWMDVRLIG
tara:strand:+ start:37 stop:546 length:510 start_codon:yes stop_codon:yes gene_type:complete